MRACQNKSRAASSRSTFLKNALAELWLNVNFKAEGNAKTAAFSSYELVVKGDSEELFLWQLGRPRQNVHCLGAEPVRLAPNFLGIKGATFSDAILPFCVAETLSGEAQLENALKWREAMLGETREKLKELELDLVLLKADGGGGDAESTVKKLQEDIAGLKRQLTEEEAKELKPELLKASYELYRYELDAASVIRYVDQACKDRAKLELAQIVEKTKRSAGLDESLDYDDGGEGKEDVKTAQTWLTMRWQLKDFFALDMVRRKREFLSEENGQDVYVRYDNRGRAATATMAVPEFNIYKPWKVLAEYELCSLDSVGRITPTRFERLLQKWRANQKTLKATMAYGVARLDTATVNNILCATNTPLLREKAKFVQDQGIVPLSSENLTTTSAQLELGDAQGRGPPESQNDREPGRDRDPSSEPYTDFKREPDREAGGDAFMMSAARSGKGGVETPTRRTATDVLNSAVSQLKCEVRALDARDQHLYQTHTAFLVRQNEAFKNLAEEVVDPNAEKYKRTEDDAKDEGPKRG